MLDSASKKLLHTPTERLRAMSGEAHGTDVARTLAELFELDGEQEPASERTADGDAVPSERRRKKKVG